MKLRTTVLTAAALPLALGAALAGCSSQDSGDSGDAASGDSFINVDDCEDPDAVTAPIEDTITLGYSAPLSGPVAGPVELATSGYKARIDRANADGGIDGVQIELSYKDDAFQPDKAKANVTEFIEKDGVDILSTFGSGPLGAVADDQNAACVPMLYPSATAPEFFDVEQYPWTVQYLPAADRETRFVADLIKQEHPGDDLKVGVAINQTASGQTNAENFKASAEAAGIDIVTEVPDTDPTAAATQLQASGANVVYHAGNVGSCAVLDTAMARIGFDPEYVVKPSNCVSRPEYLAAGDASDGVVVPSFLKDPEAPESAGDAGVEEYLADLGDDPNRMDPVAVNGWIQADILVKTLEQAAASDDGLTRLSIMEAARDLDYPSPMFAEGISWISTPERLTGISGFRPVAWSAADERFIPAGDVIQVEDLG